MHTLPVAHVPHFGQLENDQLGKLFDSCTGKGKTDARRPLPRALLRGGRVVCHRILPDPLLRGRGVHY